jgi:hypothetical protein
LPGIDYYGRRRAHSRCLSHDGEGASFMEILMHLTMPNLPGIVWTLVIVLVIGASVTINFYRS